MIGQDAIKSKLAVDIAVSPDMTVALQTWALMYSDASPWLTTDIKSLNLAAAIASEVARSITIEMAVTITGSLRADFLQTQMDRVVPKLRQMVEYGAAKGGIVLKPYVVDDQIVVNFVQADQFYPVAFDADGNLTSAVFSDQRRLGDYYYTRLEYHRMVEGGVAIVNRAYRSTVADNLGHEVALATIDDWAGFTPEATVIGVTRPLFAYFRYPLANNVTPSSPLGVSCFSRAVKQIEQADRQYSRFLWENESGERALYVDEKALDQDSDGKPFLPSKRLLRGLAVGGSVADDPLFEDWTPTLRITELDQGLNILLQKIEFQCGLAYGALSDPQVVAKTATEIASSQQRSQSTVRDGQKSLGTALDQLLYAMDVWTSLHSLAPAGAYDAAYDWDDSLIVDSEGQFVQDMRAVGMGAMAKWRFVMRNYGLTEADAKQWVEDQQTEQPQDFFDTGA